MEVQLTTDPLAFLAVAGPYLSADPVTCSVVATAAQRAAAEDAAGVEPPPGRPRWFASVLDAGRVVGAAMRTAPFAPYPAFCLPMPDAGARALAAAVLARGEVVPAVNGALPATEVLAAELAAHTGGTVRTAMRTRLHELCRPVPARPVPGVLRPAGPEDLDLCRAWFAAFESEAHGERDGTAGAGGPAGPDREELRRRIGAGLLLLHEVDGEVVHLTGFNEPAFGVARVGPVYTPPEHRGLGYASAAVGEVSRRILAAGNRPCLFTDVANPTSNRIYVALGYQPVVDMAELVVDG